MNIVRKKIIFDTSTLIAVCIYPNREPAQIFRQALQKFEILASKQTLQEISSVLARPKFDRWSSIAQRQEWLKKYSLSVTEIFPCATVTDCRDPKDNKFLELAVSAQAEIIISSDEDLLELHPYNGIEIIKLREFSQRFCLPHPLSR